VPADRHDVAGSQLCAPARLQPPVDLHLLGLQQLPRVGAVLGEPGQLQELPEPDRVLGDRDVLDRWAVHPLILPLSGCRPLIGSAKVRPVLSVLELHEIAEADHRILDPFTDAHLLELAAVARVGPDTRVLDLACGKGEMLCRWAQEFGSSGVGVDLSPVFADSARKRAHALGVADRVGIEQADASSYRPEPGRFDIAACVGATWIGGGVAGTSELLRPAVPPTGLLLIGEPFWREPPPAEVRATYDEADQFADLPGLLDRFERAGTDLVEMVLADEHSWDRYVAPQWWALRRWLDEHPDDPRAGQVREFRDEIRRAHLAHQRRYLGWGVFVLRAASISR
jgi:SAM-dependent methyltransferase